MTPHADLEATPDYGWSSTEAERSHTYLLPVLMKVLQTVDAQRIDRSRKLRVFDAGCGNGALLRHLAQQGYDVAGCDASDSGIRQAQRCSSPSIDVRQLSVYDDLRAHFGGNWDVVVATEVIEHLYAPRDFLRRAGSLLSADGQMVLSTPYHGYLKNLVMAATGTLDAHFTALWDGGHIKFWSYRTLRSLLAEFGFTAERFYGAGRCPGLWKSMIVTARRSVA